MRAKKRDLNSENTILFVQVFVLTLIILGYIL